MYIYINGVCNITATPYPIPKDSHVAMHVIPAISKYILNIDINSKPKPWSWLSHLHNRETKQKGFTLTPNLAAAAFPFSFRLVPEEAS